MKDQNKAVDLPRALEWVRKTGVNTREPDVNRSIYWLYQYVRRAERQLPVSPDVFDREIVHKSVTNGNDKQVLKDKFRETFLAVMNPAKKISLRDLPGPSSVEWRLFLQETLRWCPRLQYIDLSCNESIAGATLEPFAALGDTLEVLDVGNCVEFGGTLDALKHLRKLRELYLHGCVDLEGTLEPLRNLRKLNMLNVEACFGLQGGVHVLATLPKLGNLNISDTWLETWRASCRRAPAGLGGGGSKPRRCFSPRTAGRRTRRGGCWRGRSTGVVSRSTGRPLMWEPRRCLRPQATGSMRSSRCSSSTEWTLTKPATTLPRRCTSPRKRGSVEVAQVLLESRADMNKRNLRLATPLHLAAYFGHLAVARLLLQVRADTTLKDQWNDTPLANARRQGHEEVAMLLGPSGGGWARQ